MKVLSLSIDEKIHAEAIKRFPRTLSKKVEELLVKEMGVIEQPGEVQQIQELLELKRKVQEMAQIEGGETAIRIAAKECEKPCDSVPEKLSFWKSVHKRAHEIMIRHKGGF